MCTRGATPASPVMRPWQPPEPGTQVVSTLAGAVVPSMPPMTPATNVPWNDCDSSSGCLDSEVETSGKKALATITFGVVKPGVPLGKPAGKLRPPGSRNGCLGSMPSSTMPTLTPLPPTPVAARSAGAPITEGPRFMESV